MDKPSSKDFRRLNVRLRTWTAVLGAFFGLQAVPVAALAFGLPPLPALVCSVALLLVILPAALLGVRHLARTVDALLADTRAIRDLDFSGPPPAPSLFREVDRLIDSHVQMKDALQDAQSRLSSLVESGLKLSSERDREQLLRHILMEGKRLCHADAATLYLKTDRDSLRITLRSRNDDLPAFEIPLHDADGRPDEHHVSTYTALHNTSVVIDDVYHETRFDLSGTRRFDEATGYRSVSMLCVPLAPRDGEVIGVLQLLNATDPHSGAVTTFPRQTLPFVEALAAQAAVALENHNLIATQNLLIDSMIQILAGAIDAKSAHTGRHCERVPEIAMALAREACQVKEGPLAAFNFASEEEWREFRIGAWLHDCGKITTPEHIVDKATKLETLYNRIHEVRMRFEVLLRDARIACLQAIADGEPAASAEARYAAEAASLQEEFAFIADCNIGGELMAAERIERLQRIAERRWLRHFDDRLGLSHGEMERLAAIPASPLPVSEPLLADRPEHRIPRQQLDAFDPRYGFKMKIPEFLYDHGELHNLSIGRGTLTEEERFKINEHIIQTIVMLESLPLPASLSRVPEYAGTHHETLQGTGYPRRLDASQLSIPARIMAIADIFEALTAADRPYKKAKTLSESIRILADLRDKGHIDADLFALFLRSGLYRRYGERHLQPAQLDTVDVDAFLAAHPA